MPSKSVFKSEKFTPTQFSSSADKARFSNHFIRFIRADFPKSLFPKWFYVRLSMTFGHIAHFSQQGFFDTFFTDEEGKRSFVEITKRYSCCGDPAFTYSDVERAIQKWLVENGY